MEILVPARPASWSLDSSAQTHNIADCHEHVCPTCGLSWGHDDLGCDSGGESRLACPICQHAICSGEAPSFAPLLDAEFGDYAF
jgi:hypothetical protein